MGTSPYRRSVTDYRNYLKECQVYLLRKGVMNVAVPENFPGVTLKKTGFIGHTTHPEKHSVP